MFVLTATCITPKIVSLRRSRIFWENTIAVAPIRNLVRRGCPTDHPVLTVAERSVMLTTKKPNGNGVGGSGHQGVVAWAVWFVALVLAVLWAQRLVMIFQAQWLLARSDPELVNVPRALTGLLIGFWDQRMSWQGGGELGFVLLTCLGLVATLLPRPNGLRWIPILAAFLYVLFLVSYKAQITWESFWLRLVAGILVAAVGGFFGSRIPHLEKPK